MTTKLPAKPGASKRARQKIIPPIPTEVSEQLAAHEATIRRAARKGLEAFAAMGKALAVARDLLKGPKGKGLWLHWIDNQLGMSRRSAERLITVYYNRDQLAKMSGQNAHLFSLASLAMLASAEDEVRAIAAQRAEAGERMTPIAVAQIASGGAPALPSIRKPEVVHLRPPAPPAKAPAAIGGYQVERHEPKRLSLREAHDMASASHVKQIVHLLTHTVTLEELGAGIMTFDANRPGYTVRLMAWLNAQMAGDRDAVDPAPRPH